MKVDTVRVRLRLDAPEVPQLTKLGATLDVPGTLHGTGYVEITPHGFKGAFDLTVVPVNVRGSAALAVETVNGITGVLVGIEVEFPVPIPLGNSGLGIFGFLGGVGVNYARKEPVGVPAPALDWLEGQFAPARNSVMHPDGWEHRAGSYAFAAGMLLGTAEGGFVVHLKGIVLIEVPGPRLMLVMKADVLKLPPVLKSQSSATFLAVLDIDFGRGTITLGVVAEYRVVSLLKVRVPVTAFFDTNHPEQWFVDLGTYDEPVTVEVLDVFQGIGYLMVHGNGITHPRAAAGHARPRHRRRFPLPGRADGQQGGGAVPRGGRRLRRPRVLRAVLLRRADLRPRRAAALHRRHLGQRRAHRAGRPAGRRIGRRGERTYVHGEVCGHVDFFFFSVGGCVSLTLGESPPDDPVAPPLVAGVSLVSRSPALVEGTATDRAVDGKLADAAASAVGPGPLGPARRRARDHALRRAAPGGRWQRRAGWAPHGSAVRRPTPGSAGATLVALPPRGVELVGALQPTPPTGKTPATWWARGLARRPPARAGAGPVELAADPDAAGPCPRRAAGADDH